MRRPGSRRSAADPIACVIGEIDLVRSLALARIPCALVAHPGDCARFSRGVTETVDKPERWEPAELAEMLVAWARGRGEKPVLFYDGDWDLLMVSEERERLGEAFRFVIPDRDLVHDLVDKARFARLAEARGLPVPRAISLEPGYTGDVDLRYPVILKPLTRDHDTWKPLTDRKALQADDPTEFARIWDHLAALDAAVIVQELVPGPERLIESYHTYVDGDGRIVGEFTGRKIRTYPRRHGFSTALETSDAADVRAVGRDVLERIGFTGVAKIDFKRHPDTGELLILEINPRFSLWQHLGAKAGVNLAHAVFADLTDRPRPPMGRVRAGVRWVSIASDRRAAREEGISTMAWLRWMLGCEAKHAIAGSDPLPLLAGGAQRATHRVRGLIPIGRRHSHSR